MSWQEEIRHLVEAKLADAAVREAIQQQKSQEMARWMEQAVRARDEVEISYKEELRSIFQRLGVRECLTQIRDEVWKTGTIEEEYLDKTNGSGLNLVLSFAYNIAVPRNKLKSSHGPFVGGGSTRYEYDQIGWQIGEAKTELGIRIRRYNYQGNSHVLSVSGEGFGGAIPISLKSRKLESYKDEFQALLLEECVARTQGERLPLDLQRRGNEEIRQKVSWTDSFFW